APAAGDAVAAEATDEPEPTAMPSPPARRPAAEGRRHSDIPDTDWRRRSRRRTEPPGGDVFQPGHFLFEMRFGAYSPEVDEEFDGAATPYADFFGDTPNFYFGLELD